MVTERALSPAPATTSASLIDSAASVWAVMEAAITMPATPEVRADTQRARAVLLTRLARLGIAEHDLREHLHSTCADPLPQPPQSPENVRCLRSYAIAKSAMVSRTQSRPPAS